MEWNKGGCDCRRRGASGSSKTAGRGAASRAPWAVERVPQEEHRIGGGSGIARACAWPGTGIVGEIADQHGGIARARVVRGKIADLLRQDRSGARAARDGHRGRDRRSASAGARAWPGTGIVEEIADPLRRNRAARALPRRGNGWRCTRFPKGIARVRAWPGIAHGGSTTYFFTREVQVC